jgi:tripartite-type tricarboxylate transporter receptor subunit TctC
MLTGYWGLWTTGGTPTPILRKIADETRRTIAMPEVSQQIIAMGFLPIGSGPEEFSALLDAEFKRWKSVADAAKITLKD